MHVVRRGDKSWGQGKWVVANQPHFWKKDKQAEEKSSNAQKKKNSKLALSHRELRIEFEADNPLAEAAAAAWPCRSSGASSPMAT